MTRPAPVRVPTALVARARARRRAGRARRPGRSAEDVLRLEGPVTDTAGVLADGARRHRGGDRADRSTTTASRSFVLFVTTTGDLSARRLRASRPPSPQLARRRRRAAARRDGRPDRLHLGVRRRSTRSPTTSSTRSSPSTLEPALRDGRLRRRRRSPTIEALGRRRRARRADRATDAARAGRRRLPSPDRRRRPTGGDRPVARSLALPARRRRLAPRTGWWRSGLAPDRDRRAPGPPERAAPRPRSMPKRSPAQANALLIATDERIRDAAQEVDFAEAQYGPDAVDHLRAAVADAQERARGGVHAPPAARRRRARGRADPRSPCCARSSSARRAPRRRLDAETERIRELRDLERDAPATLVELPGRIEAVEDRLRAATPRWRDLRTLCRGRRGGPVARQHRGGRKGLAGARSAVVAGSAAMARDDAAACAVATRERRSKASTGASELARRDRRARRARRPRPSGALPAELAEAERDLRESRGRYRAAGRPTGRAVDARIARARSGPRGGRARQRGHALPIRSRRSGSRPRRTGWRTSCSSPRATPPPPRDRVVAAADSTIRTAAAESTGPRRSSRHAGPASARRARTRLAEAERDSSRRPVPRSRPTRRRRWRAVAAPRQLAQEAYRLAAGRLLRLGQRRARAGASARARPTATRPRRSSARSWAASSAASCRAARRRRRLGRLAVGWRRLGGLGGGGGGLGGGGGRRRWLGRRRRVRLRRRSVAAVAAAGAAAAGERTTPVSPRRWRLCRSARAVP